MLYTNLWIATAALAMSWQTQLLLLHRFEFSYLTSFIFVATLLLYAVHRLIGFRKLQAEHRQARFHIIQQYQPLLAGIAIGALLIAVLLFFQLTNALKILLFAPIVLAAGYTLPVLPHGRRLRDLPFLKNVLIAGVWTWITVALPIVEKGMAYGLAACWLSLGRFCFIFALSLPFDIRDMELDRQQQVRTIPLVIGVRATKILAIVLNMITVVCAFSNYWLGYYSLGNCLGIGISVLCSSVLIGYVQIEKKDWYYAGVLDGMMVLQFLLVWMLGE